MKRIGFFCFLILTCLLIIFHQTVLTRLAPLAIQTYSLSKWGSILHYDSISIKGNRLIVTQPRIEQAHRFQAEQANFDFHFDWKNRALEINIDLLEPHWIFQNSSSPWNFFENIFIQEETWNSTRPSLHITDGLFIWAGKDHADAKTIQFDLEADSHAGALIKLHFDPKDSSTNYVKLKAAASLDQVEVNCFFQKADCASLVSLTEFLGFPLPQWRITSGTFQGDLKAVFPKLRRPYLEGELFAEQLAFYSLENGLEGGVELAKLTLEKKQPMDELNPHASMVIGQFEIQEPAFLHNHTPAGQWEINDITGNVKFNGMETALIKLAAQAKKQEKLSHWTLEGMANLNEKRSLNGELTLRCVPSNSAQGKIQCALCEASGESKCAQIQLQSLSYVDLDLLQTFLSTFWPALGELTLKNGVFDATLEADVGSNGIGEIRLKQFLATHLRSSLKPWNAICEFDLVRGYGKAHLGRADFWDSIQAGLHLENGRVDFAGLDTHLPFTQIQGHLLIQKGQIENSLITLQLAGLKGKMDVEWGENKQLLTFKLDGTVADLAEHFPNFLQEGLRQHFYHNQLMVLANIKTVNQQIELGGTLHIKEGAEDHIHTIHFGCEMKRGSSDPSPKYLPLGWFYAKQLPLEKFLSPFIFREGLLHMEGDAEFKGSFDDHMLTIKYDADDLMIENEDLKIEIKHLHANIPGQLVGSHELDLLTFHHQGTLPIHQATYYDKNNGLLFHDIQGVVHFQPSSLQILPLEAICEGIEFSGNLELDYSDPTPGVFSLSIQFPTLTGKVSQIQHLLAHLEPSSLLHQIPLEGEVSGKGNGLELKFSFKPGDYDLIGTAEGSLVEGSMSFETAEMSLRGIYMDVLYRHNAKQLEFSDMQGTFIVGKPLRAEEFLFSGHHVHIKQLLDPEINLDIAINDHDDEIFRIAAWTKNQGDGRKSLCVDPHVTHLSCIYPQTWRCQLADWSNLEELDFSSQFDLNSFLKDLTRFKKCGLFFLSHCLIDKLAHFLPIDGTGMISLQTEIDQSYFFQLEGRGIKQGKSAEHYCLLKGSKRAKKWMIDQFQWDDWNAYAELQQMDERWKIPFLGLSIGQNVLLGLEGDFIPNEGLLHASLNYCEMDLNKLDGWEIFKPFSAKWHPKGIVKASGEMEWSCLMSNPMDCFKASLVAEPCDLAFRNYPFHVLRPFLIEINGNKEFSIKDAQVEIPPGYGSAAANLEKFCYQPFQDDIEKLQLSFDIPSHELDNFVESLQYHFPDLFEPSLRDLLPCINSDGSFKGFLVMENRLPAGRFLKLKLNDGIYSYKKNKWPLKQFELQLAGGQLNFSCHSQLERCPFQIIGWMNWPDCRLGHATFITDGQQQNLLVKWENEADRGCTLKSIRGSFNGCQVDLVENINSQNDSWKGLSGSLSLDFNRLSPLLPVQAAEKIKQLKLGSFYHLAGHFWMDPSLGNTWIETLYFKGSLRSKEGIFKGYQVEDIQADLQYIPGRLDVHNLTLQDPAGSLKVPSLIAMLDPKQQSWSLFIPDLSIKNLRVSLLKDTEGNKMSVRSKFRSLLIKRMNLRDFCGELNRQETWQARGNLHFANPTRKNIFHPLFAIPGEIILRLGLDPNVLNPVTGTVTFNLQGDKFYLTKMKDVYSEGRGSKFYLANSTSPSWIDFNGNLSVQIRMKQYNLIFKIAELFTVSVEGNIRKPRYSLNKHAKSPHKEAFSL